MIVLSESNVRKLADNYISYEDGDSNSGYISSCWLFEFAQDIIAANENELAMIEHLKSRGKL